MTLLDLARASAPLEIINDALREHHRLRTLLSEHLTVRNAHGGALLRALQELFPGLTAAQVTLASHAGYFGARRPATRAAAVIGGEVFVYDPDTRRVHLGRMGRQPYQDAPHAVWMELTSAQRYVHITETQAAQHATLADLRGDGHTILLSTDLPDAAALNRLALAYMPPGDQRAAARQDLTERGVLDQDAP